MWLRLAFREILNNRRFSLFFVFNLSLGLFGFLSLDAFKVSMQRSLAEHSRSILTADIGVESRRVLTAQEDQIIRQVLGSGAEETRLWTLYSMVASSSTSRLANLTAIQNNYPFYGQITLDPSGIVTGDSPKNLVKEKSAWIYPEMAMAMQVKAGDTLRIGSARFRVSDLVKEDAGNGWRSFDLAPRVYIGLDQLKDTGLIAGGSVIWYTRLFKLLPGQDSDALAHRLNTRLNDPGVEVESARQSSESVGRMQGFLNDYLGLASLVSLFLAGLGAAYLFRSFLSRRLKDIAILISLGVDPRKARNIYLLQLGILGGTAACLSSLFAWIVLPLTIRALSWFLAYPIHPVINLWSFALALLIGAGGSILICLPFLARLSGLSPGALFQENEQPALEGSLRGLPWATPALLLYWGFGILEAHSWRVGSLFVGVFLSAGALLAGLGWIGIHLLTRFAGWRRLTLRLAWRNLSRNRFGSLSAFMAIGLGTLLINLIPQVQTSLGTEIAEPKVSQVPSLFLFNIQDDQVVPLERFVRAQGQALEKLTPLIRGRLIRVNGNAFKKDTGPAERRTREEERDSRFRNRGFNLTYRERLTESEKIVKGKDFSGSYQGDPAAGPPAEISVEREFAKRLGLHLKDVLEFDIQGVPVRGQIVNLRKVQWASFQPNFFVQFQPGVLEGAPKTYLASIKRLDRAEKARLQNGIVAHFPNVSMIDISTLVEKIVGIFKQMGLALRVMALLSLFAGFVVLFSIANHQASTRRQESNLMKVLGASPGLIQAIFDWEFATLAFFAAGFGTLVSVGMSYLFSLVLFDKVWIFTWLSPLLVTLAIPLMSLVTVHAATRRLLRQKPLALLQSEY